jgi:hypothetical protein
VVCFVKKYRTYAAEGNSNAVAEHTLGMILSLFNLMLLEKFALDIGTGKAIAVVN